MGARKKRSVLPMACRTAVGLVEAERRSGEAHQASMIRAGAGKTRTRMGPKKKSRQGWFCRFGRPIPAIALRLYEAKLAETSTRTAARPDRQNLRESSTSRKSRARKQPRRKRPTMLRIGEGGPRAGHPERNEGPHEFRSNVVLIS